MIELDGHVRRRGIAKGGGAHLAYSHLQDRGVGGRRNQAAINQVHCDLSLRVELRKLIGSKMEVLWVRLFWVSVVENGPELGADLLKAVLIWRFQCLNDGCRAEIGRPLRRRPR